MIQNTLFSIGYFVYSLFTPVVLFLFPSTWVKKLFHRLDVAEGERRIESFRPFVRAGEKVLEVGAGSGRFAKTLGKRLGVEAAGVDVCDYSDKEIPFYIYDGYKLPFPDKSYDVVFFAYVLHHVKHQEELLQEACRVAKRHVVIFEDIFSNRVERWFTVWNCFHNNFFHGWVRFLKGSTKGNMAKMPFPFTFRSVEEWKTLFRKLPLTLVSQETRGMGWKPLTKGIFCLKVNDGLH
ncbi:MAG: class I SAM-dependent methyltransferase [Deltaproteobacteria bacterium]|nr:class I SAM-dependent methyltransferase [Deltaproteobacteria bacterium]